MSPRPLISCLVLAVAVVACGDKDSDDTGTAGQTEADADTDTDTDDTGGEDEQGLGSITLDDGTEVTLRDALYYNDTANDSRPAVMLTSWAGATCNVEQVFVQADGDWWAVLVFPDSQIKGVIYEGVNYPDNVGGGPIGQVVQYSEVEQADPVEGQQVNGTVRFGDRSGTLGGMDFIAPHCGDTTTLDIEE